MLKKIEQFTYSTPYLLLASLAAVVFWTLHLENIGIPIILGLMFLQFVLFRDATPSAPLLFAGLFMYSQTPESFNDIPLFLYLTPVTIIVGMIVHIIRFKTHFWHGKMVWGILIMVLAMFLSMINAEELSVNYFFYAVVGLMYALIYLFYRNSIESDHIAYLLKTMVLMGIVVSVEVLIFYLRVDDVALALQTKAIKLGWGISNYIATYLVMFIPTTIYFAKQAKHNIFWIALSLFEIIMLLFTASRGGILAFAVISLPLLIYLLKSKQWKRTLLNFVLSVGAITFIVLLKLDLFTALFFRFRNLMLDDSGRFEIYREAIAVFAEYPLFGGGLFARIDGNEVYHMYHNTFLHTLATLGLVGLVGLLWQLWVQITVVFRQMKQTTFILGISLLGAHIHGMVDNIYFMPQFMILMLILVSIVEKSNLLLDETLKQGAQAPSERKE